MRLRPTLRWTLSAQGVGLLVALLLVVVGLLLAGAAEIVHRDLAHEYEQRALAIARSVAQQPGLAAEVEAAEPTAGSNAALARGPVQQAAEAVRRATGSLYVVVTDVDGIRLSHPTVANIGKPVSTSPEEALQGREVVTVERGTLGMSARGKVPLRAPDGAVVGEVSVGISMAAVASRTWDMVVALGLVAAGVLALGVLGAFTLGRRLRLTTLGLQPDEMADLVREHAAVLGGVRDGLLAVDRGGRITVANAEAERLVGCALTRGTPAVDADLPPAVLDLLERPVAPSGAAVVLDDRVVLAYRVEVVREGRDLGRVLILRDRSDLDQAARELEATRALTDALRAQAHEHHNRIHALGGLLHLGHVAEATSYVDELAFGSTWIAGIDDPYLAGLVAAKAAAASEAGVALEVSPTSYVDGTLLAPLDVVTVLANLLDNATVAAARGARRPAKVETTLVSDGADLVMQVADSGDGISPEVAERIFAHGFTTTAVAAADHGIGLALARHTARSHQGDITLVDPGGVDGGAVFEARMAGVLSVEGDRAMPQVQR
ncbi:ATP-binding protein [Nocardioides sp.]|uniref:sensor histidine kinase n=1 Tax=Nocardioides sp. TaxID=35761 RepID=UPI00261CC75D|nr:ATP-binding protein [Nocardioides sp.]